MRGHIQRPEAPKRVNRDVAIAAVAHEGFAVQVWMELDLIERRRDRRALQQEVDHRFARVRDPERPRRAELHEAAHGIPGGEEPGRVVDVVVAPVVAQRDRLLEDQAVEGERSKSRPQRLGDGLGRRLARHPER